jgi:hypothetical protein
MPRFLRIKNNMIHVPSLSSVSMGTSCMGYPTIQLSYHTRKPFTVSYSKWEDCEKDFNRIKTAFKEVESSLEKIVLTEEVAVAPVSKVDVGQVDVQTVTVTTPSETVMTS